MAAQPIPQAPFDPFAYAQALDTLEPNGTRLVISSVVLDLTPAGFALEARVLEGDDKELSDKLFPSYQKALEELGRKGWYPRAMVTVNMADAVGKEIFDSCLAGIHLALEQDPQTSKQKLLTDLLAALDAKKAALEPAAYQTLHGLLSGALRAPQGPRPDDDEQLRVFFGNPVLSAPIGFWTWDERLKGIFAQDRLLQWVYSFEKNGAAFDALASLLKDSPESARTYGLHAALERKLNNPFSVASPLSPRLEKGEWAFLPFTRSKETDLQNEFAKEGKLLMDPMEEVIRRLKAGTLSFSVGPDSGYYDYQQSALAAILLADKNPEARKVEFGERYLKRLEEAFKTGMAKARESHVKSLEMFGVRGALAAGGPDSRLTITPFLPLEPLPTAYARYAAGFDFLSKSLRELLGQRELRAYDPLEGPASVWAKLERGRRLFYGLELLAADSLGMARGGFPRLEGVDPEVVVQQAKRWVASAAKRAELGRDARFAVPISADLPGTRPRMIHCWGTAGVYLVKAKAEFRSRPSYAADSDVIIEPQDYWLPVDKFVAFEVPYEKGPLTREQFRGVLDSSKSLEEALERLKRGER